MIASVKCFLIIAILIMPRKVRINKIVAKISRIMVNSMVLLMTAIMLKANTARNSLKTTEVNICQITKSHTCSPKVGHHFYWALGHGGVAMKN